MRRDGFTLIELSIVLVIVALLVAGVLIGRDLINTANIRAQVKQFGDIDSVANTFRLKYNYLPGDVPQAQAAASGFALRTLFPSYLGNGLVDVNSSTPMFYVNSGTIGGEVCLFWNDLTQAGLVAENYIGNAGAVGGCWFANSSSANFLPKTKINNIGNIWVVTDAIKPYVFMMASAGMSPLGPTNQPAFAINQMQLLDMKIDDGTSNTGKFQAGETFQNIVQNTSTTCTYGEGFSYTDSSSLLCMGVRF